MSIPANKSVSDQYDEVIRNLSTEQVERIENNTLTQTERNSPKFRLARRLYECKERKECGK